jgi:hypothetical protein
MQTWPTTETKYFSISSRDANGTQIQISFNDDAEVILKCFEIELFHRDLSDCSNACVYNEMRVGGRCVFPSYAVMHTHHLPNENMLYRGWSKIKSLLKYFYSPDLATPWQFQHYNAPGLQSYKAELHKNVLYLTWQFNMFICCVYIPCSPKVPPPSVIFFNKDEDIIFW